MKKKNFVNSRRAMSDIFVLHYKKANKPKG